MTHKLVLSILSARNKQTGKYLLTKDGNLHSMINRLLFMGQLHGCTIGLPEPDLIQDADEWLSIINELPCNIDLKFGFPYGTSIAKTRQDFSYDGICFASSIPGTKAKHYMCNTFVLPDVSQPCDEFTFKDLRSMAFAEHIYAYSREQIQLMPFRNKVTIDRNVCHPLYYSACGSERPFELQLSASDLLVPFNLGDASYEHNQLKHWPGTLLILNPRENDLGYWQNNALRIGPLSKAKFYGLLHMAKACYLPISHKGIFHILEAELEFFNYSYDKRTGIWTK